MTEREQRLCQPTAGEIARGGKRMRVCYTCIEKVKGCYSVEGSLDTLNKGKCELCGKALWTKDYILRKRGKNNE